ncbi:MAG: hypothetical protein WD076_08225 [Parvularculaceae bacterium]
MSNMSDKGSGDRNDAKGWADGKGFRRFIVGALVVLALGAAALGFLPEFQKEKPHFEVERFPVFFALWGFISFMFIVLVGQHLRKIVMRDERYYDERE